MQKLRLGILFGGSSSEKEISLEGGRNVYQKLDREKYELIPIFIDSKHRFWHIPEIIITQNTCEDMENLCPAQAKQILYEDLKNCLDFAFIVGHGKYMEDGCLQGLLELLRIPYNGPGVLGGALGMDKARQRVILTKAGITVPDYLAIKEIDWQRDKNKIIKDIETKIGIPCYIKPSREGCSTGICKIKNKEMIDQAIEEAFKWDRVILLEKPIQGIEVTVSVLGNVELEPLPVTETPWGDNKEFLTLLDKFLPGGAEMITPARISSELTKKVQETAIKVCKALSLIGYPRIDMFVVQNEVVVLEPNTLPGITPSTMVFHQAGEVGMSPSQFLDKIIEIGLEAHKNKKGPL